MSTPRSTRTTRIAFTLAVAGTLALAPTVVSADTPDPLEPVVENGMMQQVFTDRSTWINEELWVETEFDSDGDGELDRVHVDVTRPGETDTDGLQVPVVYETSPYYAGGNYAAPYWEVDHELGSPPPSRPDFTPGQARSTSPTIAGTLEYPWVSRGFAVVHSESPGTGLSEGCPTTGAENESLAPKAVIDWLNGRARGFTTVDGDEQVSADWSTGKVGMTGTSYNGTLPIGVASTGVEGLEAIVPVAAISDWYDYYRANGLVVAPDEYQGEDADVLADFVHTRADRSICQPVIDALGEEQDRVTGDRNAFWDERNYLLDADKIEAATLIAHGLSDWNVKPSQATNLWSALQENGVPSQIFLHQGGHGGPPTDAMMNRWFTRYLYDVDNGVEQDPRAWVVREGASRSNPTPYDTWPVPGSRGVEVGFAGDGNAVGELQILAGADERQDLVDDASIRAAQLATAEASEHRLLFRSRVLEEQVHLSGEPGVSITLSSDRPAVNLSTAIVATAADGSSRIVTRGFADPQNAGDLDGTGTPLVPGEAVTVDFTYESIDTVIPAGSTLSVMVYSSDYEFTIRPAAGSVLDVDLGSSATVLPVVGGALALAIATDDVESYAANLIASSAEDGLLSRGEGKRLQTALDQVLLHAAAGRDAQADRAIDRFVRVAERVDDETLRADLLAVAEELRSMLDAGELR